MAISIKNISLSTITFDGSLIIEGLSIAAGATKACNSPNYAVFANAQLRTYVAAGSAEIYSNGLALTKEVALSLFDDIVGYTGEVTASTTPFTATVANDIIYADATAAGGTINVVLPSPSASKGKNICVQLATAGLLQVSPISGNIFTDKAVANVQTRFVGDFLSFVSDGTNWVLKGQQTAFGKHFVAGALYQGTFLLGSLISGTINDWTLLTSQPDQLNFHVGASGTANVTGMVPNSITTAQVVVLFCESGTISLRNQDTGSSANNRFNIGGNHNIATRHTAVLQYYPNGLRWKIQAIY